MRTFEGKITPPPERTTRRRRLPLRLVGGAALIIALAAASILGPAFLHQAPSATDARAVSLEPGSPGHLLGTDHLGRDILARVLSGGRVSLAIGLAAGGLALVLGTAAGALAGFGPAWLDASIMRLIDLMLALPTFVLLLAMSALVPRGSLTVVLVIGLLSWIAVARIVRAQFRVLRAQEFVLGAIAVGASPLHVAIRHILPNAMPVVLAVAAFEVAGAILTESSLSFLGLGVPPQTPTWGNILAQGQQSLLLGQWWTVAFPAAAITLTVVGVNLIADHFRLVPDG